MDYVIAHVRANKSLDVGNRRPQLFRPIPDVPLELQALGCATRVSATGRRAGIRARTPPSSPRWSTDAQVSCSPRSRASWRDSTWRASRVARSAPVLQQALGTAEQWIKEGKQATHWTSAVVPSVPGERGAPANCSVLAYNCWATSGADWSCTAADHAHESLTSLQSAAGENRRGRLDETSPGTTGSTAWRKAICTRAAVRRHAAKDAWRYRVPAGWTRRDESNVKPAAARRKALHVWQRCLRNALKAGAPVGSGVDAA